MERRLIKQGGGGCTIYVPKKWLDKKGLKAGDPIDIVETDTELIMRSDVKEKKETTITLTDENKKDLHVIITHLYRKGFDSIIIKNTDKKTSEEISNITKELLLGFEVTQNDETLCKIENISEPTQEKYDIILRRIFLIIKETQNIIVSDFEQNKIENLKNIEELKKQQDKLILFCKRILTKERYERNPVIGWELLTFLMHIEHAHYYMYKYAQENKIKKNKDITYILSKLREYFDLYYNTYFKKEISGIHKINQMKKEFQFGNCITLIEKANGKDAVLMSYIRELFRMIQIGSSPILNELLDEQS